jgi:hypothetical protein
VLLLSRDPACVPFGVDSFQGLGRHHIHTPRQHTSQGVI